MTVNSGIRNQKLLNTWFNALITDQVIASAEEKGARLDRLERDIIRIRELVATGWRLRMTAENSPADRAGIDLFWEHEATGRWFALDCSLKEKMGLPRLIQLVRIKNATTTIGSIISLACKTIFLEQLIQLAEGRAVLQRDMIAPPSAQPVADLEPAVRDFQRKLRALKNHAFGDYFLEWAQHLDKAVGYEKKVKTQSGQVNMEIIRKTIEEGVRTYLTASLQNSGELLRPKLKFTRKLLSYSEVSDTMILADRGNPQVRGIKAMVQKSFECAFLEHLTQARKMTDRLIAVKRNFSAAGWAWVINHLLDVLEAERQGISHTISLPGKRVLSTPDQKPLPKPQAKAQPAGSARRSTPSRIVAFDAGNSPLAAYAEVMRKRKEARAR